MDMYIRVKRSKSTYFIRCKPSDKIIDIKQKLQEIIDQPVNDQRLVLPVTGEILEDSKTLADQKVNNDAVVALTLRKDDNEFEEVNIVRPNDFYQSRDADGANWRILNSHIATQACSCQLLSLGSFSAAQNTGPSLEKFRVLYDCL